MAIEHDKEHYCPVFDKVIIREKNKRIIDEESNKPSEEEQQYVNM